METDVQNLKKDENQAEESDADSSVTAFNSSKINTTVIEVTDENAVLKSNSCEGSDSGVEVVENVDCQLERATSVNSQDFEAVTSAQSCGSSIISCCSNYDEAYNLLVRRNSTLLDDYKLRCVDGTSENGSESSSVASTKATKRSIATFGKKKLLVDNKKSLPPMPSPRSRSKPPVTPKQQTNKSNCDKTILKTPKLNKTRTKPVPDNLANNAKRTISRTSSVNRTPGTTPTDDGRWPSSHSKPAPLMTRSLRGILSLDNPNKAKIPYNHDTRSTIDKYATLPRRRKERSADNIVEAQNHTQTKSKSRESSTSRVSTLKRQSSRETTPLRTQPVMLKKKTASIKTKIYHEFGMQTALNMTDMEKAFAGVDFSPKSPEDVDKFSKEVQADIQYDEFVKLTKLHSEISLSYEKLKGEFKEQEGKLKEVEQKLKDETSEKEGLREELKNNNERIAAMLGGDDVNSSGDSASSNSLLVLEKSFQNVSQVVIRQEEEISKLNELNRSLQRELDKSMERQNSLLEHQQELEVENVEMQEFMQMEKTTLSESLKELETELSKAKAMLKENEVDLKNKTEECVSLTKKNDQKRQENMSLHARYLSLEAKCRELLVQQGSTVSGAAVALSALISRLDGLVEELIGSYSISEQELDDGIFYNEAYSNSSSSPDVTPDKNRKFIMEKSPSPKRESSFMSAVINAIKTAANQSSFINNRENSKDNITDNSDSTELLDSETEPCLMMEHVLEDVVVPDGHSHNMISSGHNLISCLRLTHSESLNNISPRLANRSQLIASLTNGGEICPSVSLVDQVIDVDNLITRLLKVIRIIQIENEDYINELRDERDTYTEQINTQRETNKIVVKQLKDWETLGAQLKCEVKELLQQLGLKNAEICELRNEVNVHRKEIERLSQDVCELSTALSKSEIKRKVIEEESSENAINERIKSEPKEVVENLALAEKEIETLKNALKEKEKQLHELNQEYAANKQILTNNLQEAVNEAKKQYVAIDNALEALHGVQSIVQQSAPLTKLQQDLEEASFQSAQAIPVVMPSDCYANAALLQAMAKLKISSPINTSA